jgi:hypothetical protein
MTTHPPAARLARRSDPNPKGTSYYVDPEHSRFISRQPWPRVRVARAHEGRRAGRARGGEPQGPHANSPGSSVRAATERSEYPLRA